ncbi:nucleotide-sugar transporter [Apiospora hydei]|uniref:Nucleotide-sugar transporter n=1 Tax=Apiospora hydei TaxID=1337664 RepID=A0ABR1WYN0_9PEZI
MAHGSQGTIPTISISTTTIIIAAVVVSVPVAQSDAPAASIHTGRPQTQEPRPQQHPSPSPDFSNPSSASSTSFQHEWPAADGGAPLPKIGGGSRRTEDIEMGSISPAGHRRRRSTLTAANYNFAAPPAATASRPRSQSIKNTAVSPESSSLLEAKPAEGAGRTSQDASSKNKNGKRTESYDDESDFTDEDLHDDEETGLTRKDRRRKREKRRRNTRLDNRIARENLTEQERKEANQNVVKKIVINAVLIGLWYFFSLSISLPSPLRGFGALIEGFKQLSAEWGAVRAPLILLFPGTIAFLMTASEFALLQRSSVVTLSIAGIFKEVVTITAAALVFDDKLTLINISGLVITILAIAFYNYIKLTKMRDDARLDAHAKSSAAYMAATSGSSDDEDSDEETGFLSEREGRRSEGGASEANFVTTDGDIISGHDADESMPLHSEHHD